MASSLVTISLAVLRRAGRLLGWTCHFIAPFYLATVLAIFAVGGYRLEALGFELRATSYYNPVMWCLVYTGLGKLLAPSIPLRQVPCWRFLVWTWSLRPWREGRSVVARGVLGLLFAALLTSAGSAMYSRALSSRAAVLEKQGRPLNAAELYLRSSTWPLATRDDHLTKAGYCLWRAGKFERCVKLLEPHFKRGALLGHKAHRALWNCYREQGRPQDAMGVVRQAMLRFPHLGKEYSATLAVLEREEQRVGIPSRDVVLRVRVPGEVSGTLEIAGNWDGAGRQAEVQGWQPEPLVPLGARRGWFERRLALSTDHEFPYAAVAYHVATDGAREPIGLALFWTTGADVDPQRALEIELEPFRRAQRVHPRAERKPTADGRRRVMVAWPDCGSWYLLRLYSELGYMPNAARLLREGLRGDMMSTYPPFTSTAYLRMIGIDSPEEGVDSMSAFDTLLLQIKGITFLDRWIPDRLVLAQEPEQVDLFRVLQEHGLETANLVFSDGFLLAAGDQGAHAEGNHEIDNHNSSLDPTAVGVEPEDVIRGMLGIDPVNEPERLARVRGENYFQYCIADNARKTSIGLDTWAKESPDFMLLRYAATDLLSHSYFWTVEDRPAANLIQEAYQHLDKELGKLISQLDLDDTLIFVSDHGIQSTMYHHVSCVLVIDGPGLPRNQAMSTIPISHFPSLVLSRFGLDVWKDRLSEWEVALFHPGASHLTSNNESQR